MNNNNIINIEYDVEYNNYQKKLLNNIFLQLDIIFEIFNDDFNDQIIRIYILMKKNKLNNNYVSILFDFIYFLSNISMINQFEFLEIIMYIVKIYIILMNNLIVVDLNLIDLNLIKTQINNCIDKLTSNNVIRNLILLNSTFKTKSIIQSLAGDLVMDFFSYYSTSEIYFYIKTKLYMSDAINIQYNIKKYKKYFILIYNNNYVKYIDLYGINNCLKLKYNISNIDFKELLNDINLINKEYFTE